MLAQNLKEMRVNASVDESDIGKIQNKQPVRFRVDAYPNETFNGTVSQIRLQPVVEQADWVVPGHGVPLRAERALEILADHLAEVTS